MTVDSDYRLENYSEINLQITEIAPERQGNNSGPVEGELCIIARATGVILPDGDVDETVVDAGADITQPGFTGKIIPNVMDYRADTDPRFKYVPVYTPKNFDYTDGYLVGNGQAPNGEPLTAGITFPANPILGQYFLRTDYLPQQLFRWDGKLWVQISSNVRTGLGFNSDNKSQLSSFINNSNVTTLSNSTTIKEQQALSKILRIQPD